jgi:hypothetical protein
VQRLDIKPMLADCAAELDRHVILMDLHCDSAFSMAAIAASRQRSKILARNRTAVPTDRVLFGIGRSPAPYLTKVGGKPFRGKRPWPRGSDGRPLAFLMQLNFTDSRDLVGELPGEVLSVFAQKPMDVGPSRSVDLFSGDLTFEWQQTASAELVPHLPPDLDFELPEVWGQLVRDSDIGRFSDEAAHLSHLLLGESRLYEWEQQRILRSVFRHPRTKIGGHPYWYNPENNVAPGQFLAAFGGVQPVSDHLWPWVNHRQPLSLHESVSDPGALHIADGGIINFFFDGRQVKYAIDLM